uniref:DUF4283 domain-containing protein n=1 Tax=Ananas comosus var. bracteatus TaxID=296719 RepID=A0A6V7PVY3_ANACO|nr:unnamed protein product [Ananas comosus var. bracteatus]
MDSGSGVMNGVDIETVAHTDFSYRAWIRLINLPFECWTASRVAALVSGFNRFIKADETTKEMTDLRAFCCQISSTPFETFLKNISIVLGEELFPVMVHLESWERKRMSGAMYHKHHRRWAEATNNEQRRIRRASPQGNGDHDIADQAMDGHSGELDEEDPKGGELDGTNLARTAIAAGDAA